MGVLAHIAHARAHTHTHVLADKQTHKQTDRQGHTRAMTRLHTSDQCAAWRHSRPTDPSQILRPIVKQLECSYSLGNPCNTCMGELLAGIEQRSTKSTCPKETTFDFCGFQLCLEKHKLAPQPGTRSRAAPSGRAWVQPKLPTFRQDSISR